MNRALIRKLSGDTGTNDISRVLRVPGTYNFKLTNNPREVTVVWSDGPRYDYEQFVELAKAEKEKQEKAKAPPKAAKTDPGRPSTVIWDQKVDSLPVSDKIKQLIISGHNGSYPSRSESDMAVILALVNKGFEFPNIKSIFENYSIGEKYRQHSAKDNYLKYNIEKAKEFSNLTGSEMQDPLFISGAMQSDSGKYSLKIVRFQEYMNKKHRLKFLEKERAFFLYTGTSYEQCSEDRLNFICQNELGDHRELFSKTALSNFIHYSIADILIDADKAYEDQVQYYRLNSGTRHAEMLSSPVLRMTSSSDSSIGLKQSDCSTNYASAFCQSVQWLWWKTLKRRSQKHNMTWRRMEYLCAKWLPPVRVYHPYPLVRFGVIT